MMVRRHPAAGGGISTGDNQRRRILRVLIVAHGGCPTCSLFLLFLMIGDFVNGQRHGAGTYTSISGARFEGEWRNDKRHGFGILSFTAPEPVEGADGKSEQSAAMWAGTYEGEWRDNLKSGTGTFNYAVRTCQYTYAHLIRAGAFRDLFSVSSPGELSCAVTHFPFFSCACRCSSNPRAPHRTVIGQSIDSRVLIHRARLLATALTLSRAAIVAAAASAA